MKLTLRQIRKGAVYLILVVLASGFSYRLGEKKTERLYQQNGSTSSKYVGISPSTDQQGLADMSLFWEVYGRIRQTYLNRSAIDYKKMVDGAISGMVASLDDPYTVYLPPTDNQDAKDDLRGDFQGVGIQIDYNQNNQVSVVAPISETPADKAGIKPGDVILRIVDEKAGIDKTTEGLSLPEAVDLIRGPKGTTVKLTLSRADQPSFEVALKRDTIVVKSVVLNWKENASGGKVAVIELSRFGDRTENEWNEAVNQVVKEKNLAGVILDLRNNPGGYLEGSVFIDSEFIGEGVVVKQDNGSGVVQDYKVNRKGKLIDTPLVVLVNNGSASAAEIVAGSLQEKGRAKLVGVKTFGKGTIQQAEDLAGGGGLHVTIARWLLPSGKSIDKQGVVPDVEVSDTDNNTAGDAQLEAALALL